MSWLVFRWKGVWRWRAFGPGDVETKGTAETRELAEQAARAAAETLA